MKAYNNSTYPIFEADQVLTQKQLNTIVSYLEEQDRLTRTGTIGIGIICGMEVSFPDFNSVSIGCGTAVTSLGFEINWEEKTFDFYRDYELPASFISPDIAPDESFLNPIFDQAAKYSVFNNDLFPIKELVYVSPEDLKNNNIPEGAKTIPNAVFYKDKVIMLLLEVSLIDIENCVVTSCDDSGKKLEFKVKTLLVDYSLIPDAFKNTFLSTPLNAPLYLKRFDVPQTNLVTGQQVLNAFYGMMNAELVDNINKAINSAYENFKPQYGSMVPNYEVLKDVRIKLNETIQAYRSSIAIQYVYTWLSDIIEAYNEIYYFEEEYSLKNCCSGNVDNMSPLHVLLGRIKTQTLKNIYPGQLTPNFAFAKKGFFPSQYNILDNDQSYITPWLKIAAGGQDGQKNAMAMLLERLAYLIDSFYIPDNYGNMEIKLTPSKYGDDPLSKKSIPYYYDENMVPSINRVWDPGKTIKNQNKSILGYYASRYNPSFLPVTQPLNYNIEKYNFFRVEGHIGQRYEQVVIKLNDIKNSCRLPIKIVAVNAVDILPGQIDMAKYKGDWGSLQLDYEIVSRRWEDTIGKCLEWFIPNRDWVNGYVDSKKLDYIIRRMAEARDYTRKYFSDFLPNYSRFVEVYEEIEFAAVEMRDKLFRDITELVYREKEEPFTRLPFDAFTEEIIARLDRIINVRSLGQFRAVYQNAQERWKTISQAVTLKTFMDNNPGIQVGNGVTKGGTLVLIYSDKQGLLENLGQQPRKAIKQPVSLVQYGNALKLYANTILDKSSSKLITEFADKYALTDAVKDTSTIPDGVVIADFFLPYILNTEGTAINFIVNPPNFTPEGKADFDKPDFSSPDMFAAKKPDTPDNEYKTN